MIVVTGATGNVGSAVVRALIEAGEQVTAVSRRPATRPSGVRHVTADLAEPASLEPALTGADAVFVIVPAALQVPGATPADVIRTIAASEARRVVLLTTLGARTRPHGTSRVVVRTVEEALQAADLDWTIIRPGGFMSNAFAWVETIRDHGVAIAPFGDVGVPIVDPQDIADMAAACLLDARHIGQIYDVTGPELITPHEQAKVLSAALDRPIRFQEVTREEAKAAMSQAVPPELADDTLDIISAPNAEEQRISPDVERVLGRPPYSFTDWVGRHVVAFQ